MSTVLYGVQRKPIDVSLPTLASPASARLMCKMFDFVRFGLLFQVHLGNIPQMMLNDALAKKIVPFN